MLCCRSPCNNSVASAPIEAFHSSPARFPLLTPRRLSAWWCPPTRPLRVRAPLRWRSCARRRPTCWPASRRSPRSSPCRRDPAGCVLRMRVFVPVHLSVVRGNQGSVVPNAEFCILASIRRMLAYRLVEILADRGNCCGYLLILCPAPAAPQYAFNLFSHNSGMDVELGYNEEEMKLVRAARGHSAAAWLFSRCAAAALAWRALSAASEAALPVCPPCLP